MPIMDIAAFDFLAPEAAPEILSAPIYDFAAADTLGTGAGLLEGASSVGAAESPVVAQQLANQQMAQGITTGGIGAAQGSAEQLALEQAKAAEVANSGMTSRGITAVQTPQQAFTQEVANGFARPTVPNMMGANAPSIVNPAANMFTGTAADISSNVGGAGPLTTGGFSPITGPTTAPPVTPTWGEAVRPMYQMEVGDPATGNALTRGFDTATQFIKENPYTSAGIAYMGASKLGLLNQPRAQFGDVGAPYNGPLSKYHMDPNFKARFADPSQFQYTPSYAGGGIMDAGRNPVEQMSNQNAIGANTGFPQAYIHNNAYATPTQTPISQNVLTGPGDVGVDPYTGEQNMAAGGVAHFVSGGSSNLSSTLDYYNSLIGGVGDQQMAQARTPAGGQGDVGIFRDTDPDTAYLAAGPAAGVRMGKINAKANMQGPTLPRIGAMGQINLRPQGVKQAAASGSSLDPEVNAASGGIMHYSLGGYATGGNPRLLKGPGDGMSDDIPATIADKQPARLADGEFVVPADVVSHLGNGSTDAGAKKLHGMMNSVRKARTGNPKQGKQIDPNKYLPT